MHISRNTSSSSASAQSNQSYEGNVRPVSVIHNNRTAQPFARMPIHHISQENTNYGSDQLRNSAASDINHLQEMQQPPQPIIYNIEGNNTVNITNNTIGQDTVDAVVGLLGLSRNTVQPVTYNIQGSNNVNITNTTRVVSSLPVITAQPVATQIQYDPEKHILSTRAVKSYNYNTAPANIVFSEEIKSNVDAYRKAGSSHREKMIIIQKIIDKLESKGLKFVKNTEGSIDDMTKKEKRDKISHSINKQVSTTTSQATFYPNIVQPRQNGDDDRKETYADQQARLAKKRQHDDE